MTSHAAAATFTISHNLASAIINSVLETDAQYCQDNMNKAIFILLD